METRSRRAAGRFTPIGLTLAVAAILFAWMPGSAAAAPVKYVALGDSYSAASGVLPLDPKAPPQCLRSSLNYPNVIAERTGADLTDVTCGAAETGHFFEPQYPGMKPQLDAVKADTELVTMTIGGNDSGVFIGAILACGSAGLLTLGQGNPCETQNGSRFEDTVRDVTYPSLVGALKAVREKAPKAEVAILTYPWITPKTDNCYPQMPLAKGDIPYVRSLQTTLNDAAARAAKATGSILVDLNGVSEGHDACQPIGTRWVEPVLLGTNPVIVHPNALGERKMAERTIEVLAGRGAVVPEESAPQTRIRKVKVKHAKRRATFMFGADKAGSTFRCRIDRKPFRKCASPKTFRNLRPGKHRFEVRAIDSGGRADPTPAKRKFRIRR